ncbi:MAG: hypothetical protein KDD40_03825 [Bdellovibrionales bacterium]|nr:hypothetical protein [Bdellovibrionales bacterium]
MRFILLNILMLTPLFFANAQEEIDNSDEIVSYLSASQYELGAQMGSLIPAGISGVRDNYPLIATWFSHPTHYGDIEYNFSAAQAKGVTWQEGDLTLRVSFNIYDFFSGYFSLGGHGVRYQKVDASDFQTSFGSHFGFGNYIQLAGPYWSRVDFKFGFGPGNTLAITAGLIYRWGSEGSDSQ